MIFFYEEPQAKPRPALNPREERIVNIVVEIIWYGSIIGLFVLGAIALSQKKFKD